MSHHALIKMSAISRATQATPFRRHLFFIAVLWGASIFWIAHHPPMVDLPQHAGQIALLADLLKGESPWRDLLQINLGTPYLIGYALGLPLTFLMPIASVIKVLLSFSYLSFVFTGVTLRRHFGGDERVDWIFLLPFFGLAGYWGFLTYLFATPLVFLWIYVSDRHARRPTPKTATWVFLAGLTVMVSHGLAFALGLLICTALIFAYKNRFRTVVFALLPFLALLFPFALYALENRRMNLEMFGSASTGPVRWDYNLERLVRIFFYAIGDTPELWVGAAVTVLLLAPWIMGLRIDVRNPSRWIPFLITALVIFLAPETALNSGAIYSRFTIFLLPMYALIFIEPRPKPAVSYWYSMPRITEALLIITCYGVLGMHTLRTIRFDREEADFRTVLASMQPGHRALSMVFDKASDATKNRNVYLHLPLWYQAEKHGFVDVNFAWFAPQVVRFKPDHIPAVIVGHEWYPGKFRWAQDNGGIYRYFIVRQGPDMPANLFKGAPCAPERIAASGLWRVYENKPCQ